LTEPTEDFDGVSLEEVEVIDGFEEAMLGISADFGTGTPRAVYDVNVFLSIFARTYMVTESEAKRAVASLISQSSEDSAAPIFMFLTGSANTSPTDNYPIGWAGFSFSH